MSGMTTQSDLVKEILRQKERYERMTDEASRNILATSIRDLIRLVKVYPSGTIWI